MLLKRFPTRKSAVDTIKLHSTRQGRRVVQDPKKSNDVKITFVCSTYKGVPEDSPHKCEYVSVLRRSKSKHVKLPWGLKQGTRYTDLEHSPKCLSRPRITFREAMCTHKTVGNCPKDSIKDTKEKIASVNKIVKSSVSQHVSQRFRVNKLYLGSADYDVNWGMGTIVRQQKPGFPLSLGCRQRRTFQTHVHWTGICRSHRNRNRD